MKYTPQNPAPSDAAERKAVKPVICYPVNSLPAYDASVFALARESMQLIDEVIIPPRDAKVFDVPAGHFLRIVCPEGPQVGDLNLWNAHNLNERFFSGKTRALHGTHVSTGDHLWSNLPYFRPLATVTWDTLDWYGWDAFGGGVHDVIGTRCDPYTNRLLSGGDYHYCCHSNLTRALAADTGMSLDEAEPYVHDVLNVFMCTGFTRDTKQYFMKASPVRTGDYLEMFAQIDLKGGLSACPGGDCGSKHSSEEAVCAPLKVEIYKPAEGSLGNWTAPDISAYSRTHGLK
ncbi:urea carboxylase-associated family protein [Ahrensia kielensis]|uniref:urea carboxylase-associated family protein n=1 Tax=Ahrensia kielensis TaxID=76980 RepID=UPI00038074EB|nr:DUF1989 domain-containing protein [Ahrensia kielensis]